MSIESRITWRTPHFKICKELIEEYGRWNDDQSEKIYNKYKSIAKDRKIDRVLGGEDFFIFMMLVEHTKQNDCP